MILRSLEVQGWRCFARIVRVGPFAEGVNVVHAPNATGKSSLLAALVRGLFDSHRVRGQDVDALRPWGRSLAPAVSLEFGHGGSVYRLVKRFLDQPSSTLSRQENGRFVPLAEGESADDRVRRLLAASQPGRGLSRPAHWGLAQVLCVPQGQLAFEGLSGDLVAGIQHSLGAQAAGPEAGPLEDRLEALYGRYFTRGGKLRSGKEAPEPVALAERLAALRGRRQLLLAAMDRFEEASRRVEDLCACRAQAKREAEALEKELREARAGALSYVALVEQRKTRQAQLNSAEARYGGLSGQIEAIRKARQDLEVTRGEVARLQADRPAQAKEVETFEVLSEKARSRLEEIRGERREVKARWREVELAQRFSDARDRSIRAQELRSKIAAAERDIREGRKAFLEIAAPDATALRAIRKAVKARDDAQVRLDAALITLEIVPKEAAALEVLSAEETGRRELLPERAVAIKGAPEVVVDWPGVARIRARGPTGSVGELRDEVEKAARAIEKLSRGLGTSQLDELEQRYERASALSGEVAEAASRLETLLGGKSAVEIEEERTRSAQIMEEILEVHPGWRNAPPQVEVLRSEAKAIDRSFVGRVEEAEKERDSLQEKLAAAVRRRHALESELASAERALSTCTERLADLEKDGRSESDRNDEVRRLALEWEGARAALAEVEGAIQSFPDDPRSVAEKLERQLDAQLRAATDALEKQKAEEGKLAQLASEGPYSALACLEEEIVSLEKEAADQRLRMDAVRLLHDTVGACKSEMLAAVSSPVEERATRILKRIAGTRAGRVRLAESFALRGVVPKCLEDQEVPCQELSGGEKEQIHLAVRLALADVLAGEERQLLVLDDVLTATDTGRFARILSILEEVSQKLQLLVFTCHPERYRGLAEARFFDLEELAAP
ncbi:MAG: hypothetical protein AB1640_13775 [bacterium]